MIADALARDPELTIGEIAHWLEMQQADFELAFLGKGRAGRPKRRVNVANASRLMIALGPAPSELDGCWHGRGSVRCPTALLSALSEGSAGWSHRPMASRSA